MWEKWKIFHGLEFFLLQSMIFPRQSGCPEIFTSEIKIVKNFKKKISDIFVILGVAILCKYYWTCVFLMWTCAMGTSCRFAGWSNWVLWYYLLSWFTLSLQVKVQFLRVQFSPDPSLIFSGFSLFLDPCLSFWSFSYYQISVFNFLKVYC